jgi:hypothetical protein
VLSRADSYFPATIDSFSVQFGMVSFGGFLDMAEKDDRSPWPTLD